MTFYLFGSIHIKKKMYRYCRITCHCNFIPKQKKQKNQVKVDYDLRKKLGSHYYSSHIFIDLQSVKSIFRYKEKLHIYSCCQKHSTSITVKEYDIVMFSLHLEGPKITIPCDPPLKIRTLSVPMLFSWLSRRRGNDMIALKSLEYKVFSTG